VRFRGWVKLENPRPWTPKLAAQFPSVQSIVELGYGISGTVLPTGKEPILVKVEAPRFGFKSSTRKVHRDPPVTRTGAAVVDHLSAGVDLMPVQGCKISADGAEVSAARLQCSGIRVSRGFRAGKAYAEILFRGKRKGAHPQTGTNAAVTSQRSFRSVFHDAALFSFAGSLNKRELKDGDLIGLALDMDEQVLYWHRNGHWVTGRPGSGLGEPMLETNEEYFIAVSLGDNTESWRINLGTTPFRFPVPEGFLPYGVPRDP
jgi:hypothetical protein